MMNRTAEETMRRENNEALKNERAKKVTRKLSSCYNGDNSITVTLRDGYDIILGEETFTKDDIFEITQEKGEKLINRKISKAKAEERHKLNTEVFENFCKYIGAYVVGYTGGVLAVKAMKKVAEVIKR